jgi:hypothetical protein
MSITGRISWPSHSRRIILPSSYPLSPVHASHASRRIEAARLPQGRVPLKFPPERLGGGVLKDDPRQTRVPDGPDGVVVAAPAAVGLQAAHQRLVRQVPEDQPQALEVPQVLDFLPAEEAALW